MFGLNQNGSDYSAEGLPRSVRRYRYQGEEHFSQILDLERERLRRSMHAALDTANTTYSENTSGQSTDITEYIVFSIDAPTFEHDFNPYDRPIRSFRYTFDPTTNTLIIKMPTHEHQQAAKAFDKAIDRVLTPMGLDTAICHYGGVAIDINGNSKVADGGWGPRRRPRGSPQRPSVALEVVVSETQAKLHRDVDLWLDPSRGNAKIAIAVTVNRKRPMITVEKWEWDQVHGQSQESQHIEIWESTTGDKVSVSGSPLTIPFHLLFLRNPDCPRETDLSIGEEGLKEIAEWIWDVQYSVQS